MVAKWSKSRFTYSSFALSFIYSFYFVCILNLPSWHQCACVIIVASLCLTEDACTGWMLANAEHHFLVDLEMFISALAQLDCVSLLENTNWISSVQELVILGLTKHCSPWFDLQQWHSHASHQTALGQPNAKGSRAGPEWCNNLPMKQKWETAQSRHWVVGNSTSQHLIGPGCSASRPVQSSL